MVVIKSNNYKFITAKPFTPNLGAEIYGVYLSIPVPEERRVEGLQSRESGLFKVLS